MRVGTGPIWRPALKTQVSPMRSAHDAVGLERRIVHVAGQHDVGSVLVDPAAEVGVAVVRA